MKSFEIKTSVFWLLDGWKPSPGEAFVTGDTRGHFIAFQKRFESAGFLYWHRKHARKAGRSTIRKVAKKTVPCEMKAIIIQPSNEREAKQLACMFDEKAAHSRRRRHMR